MLPLVAFHLELVRQPLALVLSLEHLPPEVVDLILNLLAHAALAAELLAQLLNLPLLPLDERGLADDLVDRGVIAHAFGPHGEPQGAVGLLSVRRRRRHVAHDGRPGVTSQRRLQDPRELRVAERDVRALALRPLRQLVDDDAEVQEGLVDVGPFLHADPLGASLEHALGPRQVHQVERGHQHRVVSAVRGPGRVLADSPGLDHHAEDGVRPRRFRVHVGLPHVPPGDAGSEQLEHLRWVGHDLLHQPGDVHAALGVLLDLQAGDASVGSVEGSAPDGAPEQVPRAAAAHLRLGLRRGGLGGEQIQHLLIVDLEVADAHEELPALAAVDAVENVVHGEWDDARLIRAALHGVRLS